MSVDPISQMFEDAANGLSEYRVLRQSFFGIFNGILEAGYPVASILPILLDNMDMNKITLHRQAEFFFNEWKKEKGHAN